jgi:hypothetical protein
MAAYKRSYLVLAGVAGAAGTPPLGLGIEDSLTADRPPRDVDARAVPDSIPPIETPVTVDTPTPPPRDLLDDPPTVDDAVLDAESAGTAALADESASAVDTEAPARSGSVTGLLLACILGAAGGATGYYLALLQHMDSMVWAAGGGAVGLLMGLVFIRWMARR